jgi:hypothetical protein
MGGGGGGSGGLKMLWTPEGVFIHIYFSLVEGIFPLKKLFLLQPYPAFQLE